MNTIYYDNKEAMTEPCVATIGFFDGVHRGHQFLISHLVETARQDGMPAVVITFDEHPRKVLQSDYQPEMLSTLDSKLLLLSKTEVDDAVVLHFTREMAAMSAREFMQQVLHDHLHVKKLFIGYDHRFGHNREETFDDYVRYGKEMGIEVIKNQAYSMNGINISSSVIRSFLKEGEVDMANQCLGYPYTIIGKVVNGYHEGRKLGFPTANLDLSHFGQMIPAPGVYAVKARLEGTVVWKQGMMNIGTRPTFDGKQLTLETHIFNFEGDIYDQLLLVSFVKRIRGERKFESPEELAAQLKEDEQMIINLFEEENGKD
nr:bifunctional riboflavin kinase/FAD synthetase [uncultured Prevotella sp.]